LKRSFSIILLLISILSSSLAQAKPSPGRAGALSLIPGLGQISTGNTAEGLAWGVSTLGLLASQSTLLSYIGFDLWMYNMYDAYRDAGAPGAANQTALQNYAANFNPLNLIDPFSVGFVALPFTSKGTAVGPPSQTASFLLRPISMGFIGFGEEALFRGFLYPEWSRGLSSKPLGMLTSSLAFAASHGISDSSQLQLGPMLIRTVFGAMFCFQIDQNKGDLRKNIFAHSWYDILLTRNNSSGTPVMIGKAGLRFFF
jgi:membrane protease YdiL (CAAX protease family)